MVFLFSISACKVYKNGICTNGNCENGYGEKKWEDYIFKGNWKNELKHGPGIIIYNDGGFDKGNWNNDTLYGKVIKYFGKNSTFAGDSFIGHMENNRYNGFGRYYYHGAKKSFSGTFNNGTKEGWGKEKYRMDSKYPGREYKGNWKNDMRNGYGVEIYGNTGKWENHKYEGNWKNNERDGFGKYFWPDGSYFEGAWMNGLQEGTGTYTFPNGKKLKGEWENGFCKELTLDVFFEDVE